MEEKSYLICFILCIILSPGILAKFLEEDIGKSSDLLVREKRVIDRSPGGDNALPSEAVPYIVRLKKNSRLHCAATILSHQTAITAARCVSFDISMYTVFSGSSHTNGGVAHAVTGKKMKGHNPSRAETFLTGIALITVNPPFAYSWNTKSINLHVGPLLPGTEGVVSGWATSVVNRGRAETQNIRYLRSITVPIMSHQQCQNIYRRVFTITDEDICTFHQERQCGNTDAGAPLVIDNQLVGVHIGAIYVGVQELPIKPDVFALVQDLEYGRWIRANIVH